MVQAFIGLVVFCFLFRGTFLPMKYKKIVEDRDAFFVDHWTNLCMHNKLGTDCAECRKKDTKESTYQQQQSQQQPQPRSSGRTFM